MKVFSFLALAVSSAMAAHMPIQFGVDGQIGAVFPLVGSDVKNVTSKTGYDALVAGTADFPLNHKWSIRGSVGFEYDAYSLESSDTYNDGTGLVTDKITFDYTRENIELSIGPVFHLHDKISFLAGYTFSIPVGGQEKSSDGVESHSSDITWAGSSPSTNKVDMLATHSLFIGGGYKIKPDLSIDAALTIGLTGLAPKLNSAGTSYDGTESRSHNLVLNRLNAGVHYNFKL